MRETGQKTKQSGRWVKPLLVVSLAVNIAVAAMIAGAYLRHEGRGGPQGAALAGFGRPYMMALPREDRRAILRLMREQGKGSLPDRSARRALFEPVLQAIEAQPFDETALAQAVSRQAAASVAVQQGAQAAWRAYVGSMDDAARGDYAQAVRTELRRGPRKRMPGQ